MGTVRLRTEGYARAPPWSSGRGGRDRVTLPHSGLPPTLLLIFVLRLTWSISVFLRGKCFSLIFWVFIFNFFKRLFEREGGSWSGGWQREKERENPQADSSAERRARLRARSQDPQIMT